MMTLPRRGSRIITVDGIRYRWSSPRTFERGADKKKLFVVHRLIVELEGRPEVRLSASFDTRSFFAESDRMKYADFLAIVPSVVAAVIRYARANGWGHEVGTSRSNKFAIEDAARKFTNELKVAIEASGSAKPGPRSWSR